MTLIIRPGTPREGGALLRHSHALMQSLFPAEANHYLSLDALEGPEIRFFVAETDRVVGAGALALKDGYGEVKSMFVDETARGLGVGAALLARIDLAARDEGLSLLRLETGSLLHAAHRLYERAGFKRRGPFGDYKDSEFSIFMEKAL